MSNIYEALLRAEQERAAQDNAPDAQPKSPQSSRQSATNYRQPSTMWSAVAALNDLSRPAEQSAPAATVEEPPQASVIDELPIQHSFVSRPPAPQPPVPELAAPEFAIPDWLPTYAAAQPAHSKAQPSSAQSPEPLAATLPASTALPLPGQDHVPSRTWKPVLSVLPALLEQGAAVEQFRSLRSRLQEFRELNTLKTVMISSGVPQEGKTFIAANLAISLARHDASRVLLIDGDMRRASLYKMLGCPNGPGLTEFLSGRATLNEVMQRAQLDDPAAPVPNGLQSLTFIGGGDEPEHAADLSGNDRFPELIAAAAPLFDWIIVDSSPVNLVADGVNLSRACDGVVLVARGGVTKLEVAQRALSELKAAKMLGVVLNAVVDPPVADGYYGYDGYVGAAGGKR